MITSTSSSKKVMKVNAKTREQEFPGEFQALSEKALFCNFCCYKVDWVKKSPIVDHLKNEKHMLCKLLLKLKVLLIDRIKNNK